MNAQEIIEYIRTSEKKTPVKVYIWQKRDVAFPNCREFPAGDGCKIVFGDWKDVAPVLEANEFEHLEIENSCLHSLPYGRGRCCQPHVPSSSLPHEAVDSGPANG